MRSLTFPGLLLLFLIILMASTALAVDELPVPAAYFGFQPGTSRSLIGYTELVIYLQKLDQASPRLQMIEIGRSPQNRPIHALFISAEENIANLETLREINRSLALQPDLSEQERADLVARGRLFLLATLSMHSTEVAPAQAAPLIAHELASTQEPVMLDWLKSVVLMLVPTHNPDGMEMVVNHYRQYKGTPYEGSTMPGLYHKYLGHDNNRDYVTLTQSDTRAISALTSSTWFPQVMVDKHQMGANGPRYFVPPVQDPIAENLDAGLYNWTKIFGAHMVTDMTEAGLTGISQSYSFDFYWPGPTETCTWKGVIGLLTEMARANVASPVYVEPTELRSGGKGLAEYKKSINMPALWPGGWWRLEDMVEYEVASFHSLLKTAARFRGEILTFRNELCRREVAAGKQQAPFYYLIPPLQHDRGAMADLVNLLFEHGIRIYRLGQNVSLDQRSWEAGTVVIPLAQPFRAFIKEMMEKQSYPVRRFTPDGEIIKPYDITSWSLPLHMGVTAVALDKPAPALEAAIAEIHAPFSWRVDPPAGARIALWPAESNASFRAAFKAIRSGLTVERLNAPWRHDGALYAAGSFLITADGDPAALKRLGADNPLAPVFLTAKPAASYHPVKIPRIALVENWFHDMDAGWTRYLFDDLAIPFTLLRPGEIGQTNLAARFDVIIFPDADKTLLMEGKYKTREDYRLSDYPPEFNKGMGKAGMEGLMSFLVQGGRIISWGRSADLFMGRLEVAQGKEEKEEFQLPVANVAESAMKEGLYCPGSLVRTRLVTDHPLTWGMPAEIGVFYRGRPLFTTSIPTRDMDRRVIGWFPEQEQLLSGYIEKEEKLAGMSSMVWLRKGKGELILFAFNPQFRAATPVAYKLLFNSILSSK